MKYDYVIQLSWAIYLLFLRISAFKGIKTVTERDLSKDKKTVAETEKKWKGRKREG